MNSVTSNESDTKQPSGGIVTDRLLDNYMIDDSEMNDSVSNKKCITDATKVKADRFIPLRKAALIDNGDHKVSELQFEHEESVLRFKTGQKTTKLRLRNDAFMRHFGDSNS